MRLELLAKDHGSGEKGCPSVHDDLDSIDFVFQGQAVDTAELPNVLPGEGAVRVKREVVLAAIRRYQAG